MTALWKSIGILGVATAAMAFSAPAAARSLSADQYQEVWSIVFSYWTAARACGNDQQSEKAANAFQRTMNYGRSRGLLPDMARQFERDPEHFLREGEKRYLAQQWVGCSDVAGYVDQIDKMTRQLP